MRVWARAGRYARGWARAGAVSAGTRVSRPSGFTHKGGRDTESHCRPRPCARQCFDISHPSKTWNSGRALYYNTLHGLPVPFCMCSNVLSMNATLAALHVQGSNYLPEIIYFLLSYLLFICRPGFGTLSYVDLPKYDGSPALTHYVLLVAHAAPQQESKRASIGNIEFANARTYSQ
jgi:hypothetical protein